MENEKEFNCKKCNAVDNDQMVQCDKCDQWYHYDCVGVNSGIADVSWNCDGCNLQHVRTESGNESPILESNPSIANSMGPLRQPQAASSPTVTGELQQMANRISNETGNSIFSSENVAATTSTATSAVNATLQTQVNNKTQTTYSTGGNINPKSISTATTCSTSFPFNHNQKNADDE